jgi:hypothetical protein
MDVKTFLEGFDSKNSVNTSGGLNVPLRGNRKLLPLNGVEDVISELGVYNDERRACNKIRLTCQVNPVCSNVLFNRVTEIVRDEGSSAVTFLNYGISGNTNIFDDVVYKPKSLDYWTGSTMRYQYEDARLKSKDPESEINEQERRKIETTDLKETQHGHIGHPTNAIRDTQLSRVRTTDGTHFVYHCGLDILNNHLIRSNTFKAVCRLSEQTQYSDAKNDYTAFNTIADLMRDVKGYKVIEKLCFPTSSGIPGYTKFIPLHLYLYENLLTFDQAVQQRLIKKYNGWVGFNNRSKIKTYDNFQDDEDLKIERPLMYMQGGDFVDMYPGRDLYSFVPKFNHFRQRIEKNWNYCITYPSSSTTEGFDDIIETNNDVNSLKTIYFDETRRSDNGTKMLVMYGKSRHGLAQGDYVNIYKTYDTTLYWVEKGGVRVSDEYETEAEADDARTMLNAEDPGTYTINHSDKPVTVTHKILDNAEVENVVDDYIFTVFNQGVEISGQWVLTTEMDVRTEDNPDGKFTIDATTRRFFMSTDKTDFNKYYIVNYEVDGGYVNIDPKAQNISYKKVVNDIECEYYVRIFSRLPNFKYSSGDTSNEYEIYREREDSDGRNLVQIYQQPDYDFESHVSRLAFAKNIYTDEVGQIVFTDDIDLSYLKDNLGRPLSEVFLTIVKNNKGYKEWYGFDGVNVNINSSNVEYSHCFGKITCGFKMSDESIYDKDTKNIKKITNIECISPGYNIDLINPERNTDNITSEEIVFDRDINYYGDLCYYDNYNAIERVIQPIKHRFNTAQRESVNSSKKETFSGFSYDEIRYDDYDTNDFLINTNNHSNCNNKKEGYYYIPHYQIPIRTYDVVRTVLPDFLTIRTLVNNPGGSTTIGTLQNHYLSPGDKSVIYDMETDKYYYCTTTIGSIDNPKSYTCTICTENGEPTTDIDGNKISQYKLFKIDNLDVPSYAKILKDGTCRIVWRDLVNNGFNSADDTIEEYPFTNGAFYINKRVDLYLRRQDPENRYGLYADDDIEGVLPPIEDENNYAKEEDIEC